MNAIPSKKPSFQSGLIGLGLLASGVACVPESKYLRVKSELEDYRNGRPRIAAVIQRAYEQREYALARDKIRLFRGLYPEAPENARHNEYLKAMEVEERNEVLAQERELIESRRLRTWKTMASGDRFAGSENQRSVCNSQPVRGIQTPASGPASAATLRIFLGTPRTRTSDPHLDRLGHVTFQILDESGLQPVRSQGEQRHLLRLESDGKPPLTLFGIQGFFSHGDDRIRLDRHDSGAVEAALRAGGRFRLQILADAPSGAAQYSFELPDCSALDGTYRAMLAR